jgi:Holliday junction resolvase RusA-like endonuclease
MRQVIQGICPSKSNCYRIGNKGLFKTKALSDYEKNFYLQCNHYRNVAIGGLFELHLDVYYPANRADLDNALKCVLDCLQKVGAIKNDNNCCKIVAQKFIDRANPRIEFVLNAV